MYLRFLRLLAIMFGVYFILTWSVLLPVDAAGIAQSASNGLGQFNWQKYVFSPKLAIIVLIKIHPVSHLIKAIAMPHILSWCTFLLSLPYGSSAKRASNSSPCDSNSSSLHLTQVLLKPELCLSPVYQMSSLAMRRHSAYGQALSLEE
jgi:hypothetical protein